VIFWCCGAVESRKFLLSNYLSGIPVVMILVLYATVWCSTNALVIVRLHLLSYLLLQIAAGRRLQVQVHSRHCVHWLALA